MDRPELLKGAAAQSTGQEGADSNENERRSAQDQRTLVADVEYLLAA